MKLRSGKEYLFKPKRKQSIKKEDKEVPNFVKNIANYLVSQFAYAGFELYDVEYSVIKS